MINYSFTQRLRDPVEENKSKQQFTHKVNPSSILSSSWWCIRNQGVSNVFSDQFGASGVLDYNNNHNLLDREVILMNEQLSLKFKNDVKVARF